MFFNPVVGMLHNCSSGKWHPILFREAPFPGGPDSKAPVRLRSKAHHTDGFEAREDALVNARELAKKCTASLCIERDIEWDGSDVPAMNVLCLIENGEVKLLA